MNEEAFAVHVLMSPFLHPRPSQSSGSPECGLERPGATLEVREPVRPRIDVVRRRAVNAAADRVTACAPTVGRDTSARNAPTAIAKRDESRHLGGRRTERADTDVVRDSSHPLYVGGGGVIHSQRTDESACAHSASSAMADCPPARPSQRSPRREGDTRVEQRAVALNHRRTGTTWPPSPYPPGCASVRKCHLSGCCGSRISRPSLSHFRARSTFGPFGASESVSS